MYDRIGLKVANLDASVRFYTAALAPLGYVLCCRDGVSVDRYHVGGVKNGGRDNGPPGLRADYSPAYYTAFLIDPDGNNVEGVYPEEGA
jgi:hypothetical protein